MKKALLIFLAAFLSSISSSAQVTIYDDFVAQLRAKYAELQKEEKAQRQADEVISDTINNSFEDTPVYCINFKKDLKRRFCDIKNKKELTTGEILYFIDAQSLEPYGNINNSLALKNGKLYRLTIIDYSLKNLQNNELLKNEKFDFVFRIADCSNGSLYFFVKDDTIKAVCGYKNPKIIDFNTAIHSSDFISYCCIDMLYER